MGQEKTRHRFEHMLREIHDDNTTIILPTALKVKGFDHFRGGYLVQNGNLFIPSRDLAFEDTRATEENKEQRFQRAGLLITEEGMDTVSTINVRARVKIFELIERGVQNLLEKLNKPCIFDKVTDDTRKRLNMLEAIEDLRNGSTLADGIKLDVLSRGGNQSYIFLLTIDAELLGSDTDLRLVIKTRKDPSETLLQEEVGQSYINEMLQTQMLQTAVLDKIPNPAKLVLPRFLFASANIACRYYVEGKRPVAGNDFVHDELWGILTTLEANVLVANHKSTPLGLWDRIGLDFKGMLGGLVSNNFIKTSDGSIVFIDPFFRQ